MRACSICKRNFSGILMNNRWVCFKCDELLFDIEIESEEGETNKVSTILKTTSPPGPVAKTTGQK